MIIACFKLRMRLAKTARSSIASLKPATRPGFIGKIDRAEFSFEIGFLTLNGELCHCDDGKRQNDKKPPGVYEETYPCENSAKAQIHRISGKSIGAVGHNNACGTCWEGRRSRFQETPFGRDHDRAANRDDRYSEHMKWGLVSIRHKTQREQP